MWKVCIRQQQNSIKTKSAAVFRGGYFLYKNTTGCAGGSEKL